MDALFHTEGRFLVVKDTLKSFVSEGAMLAAVYFSILAEIPSDPEALETSSAANNQILLVLSTEFHLKESLVQLLDWKLEGVMY